MNRLIGNLEKILDWSCLIFLLLMICIGFLAIICRYLFNQPIVWSQELLIALNMWFVFFASAIAFWRNRHIAIDFVVNKIENVKIRLCLSILKRLLIAFFLIYLIWGIIKLQPMQVSYKTPALGISGNYLSISVGISAIIMLLMNIYLLRRKLGEWYSAFFNFHLRR